MPEHELNENQEMFLERLWCLKEKDKNAECVVMGTQDQLGQKRLLEDLREKGYLKTSGEDVDFLPKGEAYTRDIIRRRRLTEVLLYNILKLGMNAVETSACKIEHIINQEVTDSICAFLGHPDQCPHGRPIPRGNCCRQRSENIEPLIKPLNKIPLGKQARVVFVASDEGGVLRRLTSLGVYPGAVVSMRQHQPTAILKAGETDIALEPTLIERIHCRLMTL
ncbi:MAG TPA: metal-dependent transcriptional regulator [Candidatus Omnitrophota bacterium]|nr:metal-dependent transcriptional regulator [Candidatus Omnitrophota bacterium]